MRPFVICRSAIWIVALSLGLFSHCSAWGQVLSSRIDDEEMMRICRWLNLSDEQEHVAWQMYHAYVERWEDELGARLTAYIDLRNTAFEIAGGHAEGSVGEAFKEVYRESDRLRGSMSAHNEMFFGELLAILHESQVPAMQRVMLGHDRRTYRASLSAARETNVDLVALLDQISPTEEEAEAARLRGYMRPKRVPRLVLSPEEARRLEPLVREFEVQFVQALKQFRIAGDRSRLLSYEAHDLLGAVQAADVGNHDKQAAERTFNESVVENYRFFVPTAEQLVRVNRSGLARFKEALHPEKAKQLQALYDQIAYPEIYPDPAAAFDAYNEVLAFEDLTDDQRSALAALQQQYEQEHARLSSKMAVSAYERGMMSYRRDPVTYTNDVLAAWDELRQMGDSREKLNETQYNKIKAVLTPQQAARAPKWPFGETIPPRPWWSGNSVRAQ